MSKWVKIGIVLVLAASVLCLYLGIRGSWQKEEHAGEGQVTLFYTGWGTDLEKEATEELIREFERLHPGVHVDYTHIPDDYEQKMDRMVETGKEPDVAMVTVTQAMQFAQEDRLSNIARLAEEDDEISLDDVLPQTICWWEEGKACGVNSALEVNCLFYNKKLTDAAGVEVPAKREDAWSWEEFVEAAQKLTLDVQGRNALDENFDERHIKRYGIQVSSSDAILLSNMYAFSGESFLDETKSKVNLTGTKALEGMQKIADLINVYHVMPNPFQEKELPYGVTALQAETAAMLWDGQWLLMECAQSGIDFGIGVLPAMYGTSVTVSLGEPIVMFSSTDHPDEAFELVKFFMEPEHVKGLMESGLWMPVRKSWYEEPSLLKQWAVGNSAHPEEYQDAVIEPVFHSCQPHWGYSVKNFGKMMDLFSARLEEVWMGEITAEQAAASAEDELNELVEGEYLRE